MNPHLTPITIRFEELKVGKYVFTTDGSEYHIIAPIKSNSGKTIVGYKCSPEFIIQWETVLYTRNPIEYLCEKIEELKKIIHSEQMDRIIISLRHQGKDDSWIMLQNLQVLSSDTPHPRTWHYDNTGSTTR